MEEKKTYKCETCGWRRYSENNPEKFWARVWRWHTKWCPGWKAYMKATGEAGGRQE